MSKRSASTFALNSESYANSDNYLKCVARKELLNSVNRSNVNQVIITNYGEDKAKFTSLLHAAISHGDQVMCERVLSIGETKLNLENSEGENAVFFAKRIQQKNSGENKAVSFLIEFLEGKNSSQRDQEDSRKENLILAFLKKLKSYWQNI
jgi:hypothetical protein